MSEMQFPLTLQPFAAKTINLFMADFSLEQFFVAVSGDLSPGPYAISQET
jgi:hypothetical protein